LRTFGIVMRLRVVVAGAGRAAQLLHLPQLLFERERFDVVGVADPAPAARAQVASRFGFHDEICASVDELLERRADALLCATPLPFHTPVVCAALAAGLHVLCEKPAAVTLHEHDELAAARERAGRIVQIGYVKRFDPAYRRLIELLPEDGGDLVYLGADVNDPQERPFVSRWVERDRSLAARASEVEEALIRGEFEVPLTDEAYQAYRHGFLSSLVHDVNLVHGILTTLGHRVPIDATGSYWARGTAVALSADVAGGRVEARHVALPLVAAYAERLRLLCRDRILELTFPSPYLPRRPACLVEQRSSGEKGLMTTEHHVSYDDRVQLQLLAFHAAVTADAPPVNSLEEARVDLEALHGAFRAALAPGEAAQPRVEAEGRE
jgi:hypothetical protein